ncbi:hypothetical protein ZWY2020_030283 [Hordeum vulgare]|nr:hypothetical protein ZWY2020_030283 [Hordeum vulgare]
MRGCGSRRTLVLLGAAVPEASPCSHAGPGPAEKKKKSKKKKAVAAIPGGAGCPTPPGAPEQEALDPPPLVAAPQTRCASTVDALVTSARTQRLQGPAEAVPEPGDGGLDDEGGSSKDGSSSEGDDDDGVASPAPSDGRRNPDSLAARPPGLAGDPPFVALVPVTAVETGSSPPGAAVPAVVAEEEVSVGMEVCPASSPRSHGVVCYCSPKVPPSPTLGSPATGLLPAVDLGWVSETPPASRSRPREGASPVVAAHQSVRISQSRILQDGRIPTIPELAARLHARDLLPARPPSPPSSSSLKLALTSDMVPLLADVAVDSGIVFRGEKVPPLEQISALCAKERLEGREACCLAACTSSPGAPRTWS